MTSSVSAPTETSVDDYGLPPFPMPQQVSALTGIPVSTLAYWRFEGSHLPFLKLGRSVRYRRADVLNFIDSHVYSTTAEAKAAK